MCVHTLHAYNLNHSPRCSLKQKQSAAVMSGVQWRGRRKGSNMKWDGAALMLSVNFIEQLQTPPDRALSTTGE